MDCYELLRTLYFQEKESLEGKIFGPLRTLEKTEYSSVYNHTGLDVDGRRKLLQDVLPCMEKSLHCFVLFCKMIPGFRSLPITDQTAALKGEYNYYIS